jgi:hypothetical protein
MEATTPATVLVHKVLHLQDKSAQEEMFLRMNELKRVCNPEFDKSHAEYLQDDDWAGRSFMRAIAESALLADRASHILLRPVLIELKKECPKPA